MNSSQNLRMQPSEDWIFKEVISKNEVTGVGPNSTWLVTSYVEEVRTQTHTRGKTRRGQREKVESMRKRERPQERLSLMTSWSQISSPQNWERIKVWGPSQLGCETVLRQPRKLTYHPQRNTLFPKALTIILEYYTFDILITLIYHELQMQ